LVLVVFWGEGGKPRAVDKKVVAQAAEAVDTLLFVVPAAKVAEQVAAAEKTFLLVVLAARASRRGRSSMEQ
jgi:hypothetical protein